MQLCSHCRTGFSDSLPQENQHHLLLQSTLQELSLYDFQVEFHYLGREIAQVFQANPLLPGVIIMKQGQFAGVISRRRFLEYMSRPYGLELYLKRPIECLYRSAQTESLILPGTMLIVAAAKQSLQRSADGLYEPIVVEVAPQVYRLLDVHQLLVAQSQIHELATGLLTQLYQDLEQSNEDLERLASSDGLTQVANRRHFDKYLDRQWQQLEGSESPLSLIFCDVDFFKKYNDTYGHQAGDECLRLVASAIQRAVKHSADFVARYGGEEFAVILPNTPIAGAVSVAEAIRLEVKALEIPHAQSSVSPYVTLSLGVASLLARSEVSPKSLIASADQALYHAKAAGRDTCYAYVSGESSSLEPLQRID